MDTSNYVMQAAPSVRIVKLALIASMGGIYYYNWVAYNGMKLILSSMGSLFSLFLFGQVESLRNLRVCRIQILPCGEKAEILLQNGVLMHCEIRRLKVAEVSKDVIHLQVDSEKGFFRC